MRNLFETQARSYPGMSGEEFRRQYRAGLLDYEQSDVIRVSFLLPFVELSVDDETELSQPSVLALSQAA